MKTSTRYEPNDRDAESTSRSTCVQGLATTSVRCRLCRETIVLQSNFRPTSTICPHCGLRFVFDPQAEPLPVRGMRLRYSEVLEAQRRPGAARLRRHDAHVEPAAPPAESRTNYLAWVGSAVLAGTAAAAYFGGWFQRMLAR
jgi:hypothetical protein